MQKEELLKVGEGVSLPLGRETEFFYQGHRDFLNIPKKFRRMLSPRSSAFNVKSGFVFKVLHRTGNKVLIKRDLIGTFLVEQIVCAKEVDIIDLEPMEKPLKDTNLRGDYIGDKRIKRKDEIIA